MNQVTIWKVGNQKWYKGDCDRTGEMGYRNIWAPEIHRVGDYWVIYFTESESAIDAYSIRCHALVLSGERDPYDTALKNEAEGSEWIDYQMQAWPEDSISNYYEDHSEVPFTSPFCLDMTYFEDEANG